MCCCLWGKKREAARVRHSRTTNDDSRGHNVDLESGPHSRVSLPDAVHFRESKTPLPGTADVEISEKADVEPPSYKAVMAQRVDAPVEPVRQPLGPDVGQHDESRRSSSASISDNISEGAKHARKQTKYARKLAKKQSKYERKLEKLAVKSERKAA